MTLAVAKFTEMPLLRCSLPPSSSSSYYSSHTFFSFTTAPKSSFRIIINKPFASLHSSSNNNNNNNKKPVPPPRHNTTTTTTTAPWMKKWPPLDNNKGNNNINIKKINNYNNEDKVYVSKDVKGQKAIERIVLRLRNLGLGSDDDDEVGEGTEEESIIDGSDLSPVTGDERLGDLLKREWVRPDKMLLETDDDEFGVVLPWEREEEEQVEFRGEDDGGEIRKKRTIKAPTLAELTLEDEELRRLRTVGMQVRERINVPKAGLTKEVMEKIHLKWRKEELVRLKFHEDLATDMRTAHEIVERRTGGLVVWKSGSVMMVYRGKGYEGPCSRSQPARREGDSLFVPDVSSANQETETAPGGTKASSSQENCEPVVKTRVLNENLTEEEIEFNSLLDSLGPRFEEWWGTGILPVDADLLPQEIPGYKTPFRLLPTGMRARLTNQELTDLRKVSKSLPCHFALGRNRHHQGLAAAIIKLWEKSLVAKIAVKRGIQNTNNKLMAEEINNLTGGVLLMRNKYFIVIYRGKDFLPTSVAATLTERQEITKQIQDTEEKVRVKILEKPQSEDKKETYQNGEEKQEVDQSSEYKAQAPAGTLAEFYEAQARWGRDISAEEREKMVEESSRAKKARLVNRIEHKLSIAQAKKLRAEKLLSKIESSMLPAGPDYDQETITDEERVMFRRVGLRMKPYLPLGIRGVFDGVIENMHLHWKYRELVKLLTKQKTLAFVEDTARLLEYESGGILVAIERVPKGYVLIFYRGKNYQRPIQIRPRNLLTKAKALKRSLAMQRHEALSQHIDELERTIEQMTGKLEWSIIPFGRFDVLGWYYAVCVKQSLNFTFALNSHIRKRIPLIQFKYSLSLMRVFLVLAGPGKGSHQCLRTLASWLGKKCGFFLLIFIDADASFQKAVYPSHLGDSTHGV
ncbi:hypothetical protein ACFE04_009114 [Oxalis oulophora]